MVLVKRKLCKGSLPLERCPKGIFTIYRYTRGREDFGVGMT